MRVSTFYPQHLKTPSKNHRRVRFVEDLQIMPYDSVIRINQKNTDSK